MNRRLLSNWQLKLIAVGLAVMVWFTVQRETKTDITVIHNVRVSPIVEAGWQVSEVEPTTVSVEIRGDRQIVTMVTADHFQARPDLSGREKNGDVDVELAKSAVLSPSNVRILSVQPQRVRVNLKPSQSD
jgi:YbbR domain-containing protein